MAQTKKSPKRFRGVVIGIAGALALAGVATAAIPDKDGVFNACYESDGLEPEGAVRLVHKPGDCTAEETATSWNHAGPAGQQGPAGPQGATGPQGPAGTALGLGRTDASEQPVDRSPGTFVRLGLPPGGWYVSAYVDLTAFVQNSTEIHCRMTHGERLVDRYDGAMRGANAVSSTVRDFDRLTLQGFSVATGQLKSLRVICERGPGSVAGPRFFTVDRARINAIQVSEVRDSG